MPAALVLFLTLACSKNGDECTDVFYADADGDGHGDPDNTTTDCEAPNGFTDSNDDCDDANAAAYPGAEEVCDGADNDCDTEIDVGASDQKSFYSDTDGDGYGVGDAVLACDRPGDNYVGRAHDCDDKDPAVNPGADEVCDGLDNDCDELTDDEDDDVVAEDWFADTDLDHYGDPATEVFSCEQPAGYIGRPFDCDDTNPGVNPEAPEV